MSRFCFVMVVLTGLQGTTGEVDYFPGLRKPPQISNYNVMNQNENYYLLAQLNNIIEEQARRRFQKQQQLQQQQQLQIKYQNGPMVAEEIAAPGFTYTFPIHQQSYDDKIPFAITPADPKYYENMDKDINKMQQNYEEDYQDMVGKNDDSSIVSDVDGVPSYKLKAPMEVKPKNNVSKARDDLKSLVEKLQVNGQESAIINNGQYLQRSDVVKKHVQMDPAFGMYVVALISGISAAISVGLIALGVAWYTLHKKGLAAADVEYPAYGVTGPNKDISPSGDRRLAQSAQMYHYQHQKQQIIAMENRSSNERNGSLSDVESDDENEEGDYTVYECPGLAPTGEMEVKNPLFLDDPTPATPAAPTATSNVVSPQQASQKKSGTTTSSAGGNTNTSCEKK